MQGIKFLFVKGGGWGEDKAKVYLHKSI